ncbi:hypothetical protein QE152_g9909 [Popillia japonica]|uniref:Uncharacterized protein n=1 Tax=Popillia japonica TaxID=7064 RepID=A0AAW1LT73_POPJA
MLLRLGRARKLIDALAHTLEYEATKHASHNRVRVRVVTDELEESANEELEQASTEDLAIVHGEVNANIAIGNITLTHIVIVADSENEFILDIDIMKALGCGLDFKCKVMRVNDDEVVLHHDADVTVPIVLGEDTTLSGRTEVMARALLDGSFQEVDIVMLEPESHNKQLGQGILVAKELVRD